MEPISIFCYSIVLLLGLNVALTKIPISKIISLSLIFLIISIKMYLCGLHLIAVIQFFTGILISLQGFIIAKEQPYLPSYNNNLPSSKKYNFKIFKIIILSMTILYLLINFSRKEWQNLIYAFIAILNKPAKISIQQTNINNLNINEPIIIYSLFIISVVLLTFILTTLLFEIKQSRERSRE
ncbi:MAG: hypothetical protein HQK51_02930 [Oligoflexia bacterium]|nr:hypothetical protein [Oligoflexia bacterium]